MYAERVNMRFCMFLVGVLLYTAVPFVQSQDPVQCVKADYGQKILKVEDEGGCGILRCYNMTANETDYMSYNFDGWILPSLQVLLPDYNDSRIWVGDDPDWTLTVTNISRHDVGLYHCMVTHMDTGKQYVIRCGLNSRGPFFITRWEEYKMNTIVGVSAFAGFLVIVIACYLLWQYRWQPEKEEMAEVTFAYEKYKKPASDTASVSSVSSVGSSVKRRRMATTDGEPQLVRHIYSVNNNSTAADNKAFVEDGFLATQTTLL